MAAGMTAETVQSWTKLVWDSHHFGIAIARLDDPYIKVPDLRIQIESARRAGIRCLYWLADPILAEALPHSSLIKILDSRILYQRRLARVLSWTPEIGEIRIAEDEDLPALRSLAAKSHLQTRFHEDGAFSEFRARELYSLWIEGAFLAPDQVVFVSGRRGRPTGYITCAPGPKTDDVHIGLVAVSSQYQRLGLGSNLLRAAIRWAHQRRARAIVVATQGRNAAARTLYERNQFTAVEKRTWVHIWLEGGKVSEGWDVVTT